MIGRVMLCGTHITALAFALSFCSCRNSEPPLLIDVVPELACEVVDSWEKIFVASEGVLREYTLQNDGSRKYVETFKFKPEWRGRLLSLKSLKDADKFIAVVFDVNSPRRLGSSEYFDCYSLYSFRIESGRLIDTHLVQDRFIQGFPVDDSTFIWESQGDKGHEVDCYRYFRVMQSKFKFEDEVKRIVFSNTHESELYCFNDNMLVFSTTSKIPFLVDKSGHVKESGTEIAATNSATKLLRFWTVVLALTIRQL